MTHTHTVVCPHEGELPHPEEMDCADPRCPAERRHIVRTAFIVGAFLVLFAGALNPNIYYAETFDLVGLNLLVIPMALAVLEAIWPRFR